MIMRHQWLWAGLIFGVLSYALLPAAGWAEESGEKTFKKRCSKCHELPDPAKLTSEEWAKQMEMMAPFAGVKGKKKAEVLDFLQAHSKKATQIASMAEERKLFVKKCSLCHTAQRVFLEPLTPKSRRHIVLRMQERAPDWISQKEAERILAYLDQGAPGGKKPVKKKVNGGAGAVFRERCTACHSLERVYLKLDKKESTGSAWMHIVKRMREKTPGWISKKEAEQIAQYLKSLKPLSHTHEK